MSAQGSARRSRAVFFWVAVGVFVAVLAAASLLDPQNSPPVQASEGPPAGTH